MSSGCVPHQQQKGQGSMKYTLFGLLEGGELARYALLSLESSIPCPAKLLDSPSSCYFGNYTLYLFLLSLSLSHHLYTASNEIIRNGV